MRDLSKVLVATLASAGFFIVNSNAWGIADQLAFPALLLIAVLPVGGLGVPLTLGASRSRDRALTQRANAATAVAASMATVVGAIGSGLDTTKRCTTRSAATKPSPTLGRFA